MKNKYTIIEAAKKILSLTDDSMSVAEIYAQILEKSLYVFHAQDPISVLRGELRSHSVGIDFPTASSKKYFLYDESNRRFRLLGEEKTQIKKGGKEHLIITILISLKNINIKRKNP